MRIRPATRQELDLAVGWAEAEGWDPGRGDADAFWAADPGGYWAGERDGEVIATVSLVRHGPSFGFVGFYIVRPDLRGEGHGHALWRAVVDASPLRTLGLDGVPDQQGAYERSGFVLAHRNTRYTGTIDASTPPRIPVVEAASLPAATLAAYDDAHAVAPRPAFRRAWLDAPGRTALAVLDGDGDHDHDGDGALRGLGVLRPSAAGHRVGPLLARDPETAEALLLALGARAGGPVSIDVPLANAPAVALAEGLGLRPSFQTARMYRGPDPGLPIADLYGITSLELG